MKRKIGMVLYWGIGFIFIFLAYVIGYNSGASNKYYDLLNTALDNENHVDVARAFSMYGIPLDSTPVYDSETNQNEIVIYNAINQTNLEYKDENNNTVKYSKIDYMYYLFIYKPAFSNLTINDEKNLTGLKFYNSSDETFKFNFYVSDTVNKDEIKDPVTTPSESLFNAKRDVIRDYSDYGFIFMPISELFMEKVNAEIGDIVKFEIIDSNGDAVGNAIDLSFDFTEKFYVDMLDFRDNSRTYNELNAKSNISAAERTQMDDALAYINDFNDRFQNGEYDENYVAGYLKSDIYNAKLVWSSIGIAALFAVVLAVVFILIFYFKRIKDWAFGNHSRRTQRIVPNKPKTTTGDTKTTESKTNFDRVNEQRRIDLEKKRAREEAIRKSGNAISKPEEKTEAILDTEVVEDKPVEENVNLDTVNNESNENQIENVDTNEKSI